MCIGVTGRGQNGSSLSTISPRMLFHTTSPCAFALYRLVAFAMLAVAISMVGVHRG